MPNEALWSNFMRIVSSFPGVYMCTPAACHWLSASRSFLQWKYTTGRTSNSGLMTHPGSLGEIILTLQLFGDEGKRKMVANMQCTPPK